MTKNKRGRSRLSYANERPEFANDNPLIKKAKPLTDSFEKKRCPLHAKQLTDAEREDQRRHQENLSAFKSKRRGQSYGSPMIRNHKQFPELKPSPALSHRIKAQSHYQQLAQERKAAGRKNKIQTNPINTGDNQMENIQNQNANGTGHKPEAVIRDGSLKATIWRNVNNEGQAYYSTSLAKIYTDAQGNPRDTKNFSQSDLLRVAELSRDAYAKISEMKRGHSQEQSQGHNTQQDREAFKQSRRQSNAQNMQSQTQGY